MTIRAVLFDIGGVLVQVVDTASHRRWAERLGLSPEQFAEAIYGNIPCPRPRAWTTVHLSGWHDEHEAALGLAPLSHFYGMVNEYRKWQDEGVASEVMVSRLDEQGFPALLLELRQLFMVGAK